MLALPKVAVKYGIQAKIQVVGRDVNPHYTFLREVRFYSQTETSACLTVSHFLQTNRILQGLFMDSLFFI